MSKLALIGVLLGLSAAGVCYRHVLASSRDHITAEPAVSVARPAPPAVLSSAGARPRATPASVLDDAHGSGSLDAFAKADASIPDPSARVNSIDVAPDDVGTPSPSPPVCKPDQSRSCDFHGKKGLQGCNQRGQWTRCGLPVECVPGQKRAFRSESGGLDTRSCGLCLTQWVYRCDTPLVLSFDAAPVSFTDAPGSFDLRADGTSISTTRWVSPATPWLALDLDHSGAIEDARELFGSASLLPSGARAHHGFEALAMHDDDHDGWLTPRDAIWPHLLLWTDADQDRRSSPDELTTLGSRGVRALAVSFRDEPRCERGACEVERSVFRFVDAEGREREGALVDVHFASR